MPDPLWISCGFTTQDSLRGYGHGAHLEGPVGTLTQSAALGGRSDRMPCRGHEKRRGTPVVVEKMDGKDVDSLWGVFCALEGRPNSKQQSTIIGQGVVTRVESRHKAGTLEERLPPKEVSWQKYGQRRTQGRRMG